MAGPGCYHGGLATEANFRNLRRFGPAWCASVLVVQRARRSCLARSRSSVTTTRLITTNITYTIATAIILFFYTIPTHANR